MSMSMRTAAWTKAVIVLVCAMTTFALGGCDWFERSSKDPMRFSEYQRHVVDIDEAEAIDDPLERCMAYPTPPEFQWSQAMIHLFCQDTWHPVTHFPVVKGLIERQKWAELDRHFEEILRRHHAGEDPEYILYRSFPLTSWKSMDEGHLYTAKWLSAAPDSAYANMAHGKMLTNQAWSVFERGDAASAAVRARRARTIAIEAMTLLRKASVQEPRLTPAYRERISLAMILGDSQELESSMKQALEVSPTNYYVRARLMDAFEYSSLASVEYMQWLVDEAKPHVRKNPRLKALAARAATVDGDRYLRRKWYGNALDAYRDGLKHGPSERILFEAGKIAHDVNHDAQAVMYLTQAMRFSRYDHDVFLAWRASAWSKLDESGRAYCDHKKVLDFDPDNERSKKIVDKYELHLKKQRIDIKSRCGAGNIEATRLRKMVG